MPILEANLNHGVSTGITYKVLIPGVVPYFEECEACRWANFNLREWATLDVMEKALIVAQYRLSRAVQNHSEDAVAEAAKRDAEKK